MSLLAGIKSAEDLKRLRREQLPQLAQEIRDRLIEACSITGGHIGAKPLPRLHVEAVATPAILGSAVRDTVRRRSRVRLRDEVEPGCIDDAIALAIVGEANRVRPPRLHGTWHAERTEQGPGVREHVERPDFRPRTLIVRT